MRANCEVRIPGTFLPMLWGKDDVVCDKPSVGTVHLLNEGDPRDLHVCVEHYDQWMAAGDE